MNLRPVLSIDGVFQPKQWRIGEVVPIFDKNGDLLIYARHIEQSVRNSLPTEIFHHQLKELDLHNPWEVAAFMSEFGMFGNHSRVEVDFYDYRGTDLKDILLSLMKFHPERVPVHTKAKKIFDWHESDFEEIERAFFPGGMESSLRSAMQEQFMPRERELLEGLDETDPDMSMFSESGSLSCSSVTPSMVKQEYEQLMTSAFVADALVSEPELIQNDAGEFFERKGISASWICDLEHFITFGLAGLNEYINDISISVGYFSEKTNEPIFPGHSFMFGTLEQAIGLQIQEFLFHAMHDGCFICSHCGQVFAQKQSGSTNARKRRPSANTDAFCCVKCKNARHSRKHRESPAYKNRYKKKSSGKAATND